MPEARQRARSAALAVAVVATGLGESTEPESGPEPVR